MPRADVERLGYSDRLPSIFSCFQVNAHRKHTRAQKLTFEYYTHSFRAPWEKKITLAFCCIQANKSKNPRHTIPITPPTFGQGQENKKLQKLKYRTLLLSRNCYGRYFLGGTPKETIFSLPLFFAYFQKPGTLLIFQRNGYWYQKKNGAETTEPRVL